MIDQQRVDDAANLHQLLPFPAVASESRDLPSRHCADFAQADFRHHLFKTGACDVPLGGSAKILVDNVHLLKAQLLQAGTHRVLQTATLVIVHHLIRRRLTHIQYRLTLGVTWKNLLTHRPPPPTVPSAVSASSTTERWIAASSPAVAEVAAESPKAELPRRDVPAAD